MPKNPSHNKISYSDCCFSKRWILLLMYSKIHQVIRKRCNSRNNIYIYSKNLGKHVCFPFLLANSIYFAIHLLLYVSCSVSLVTSADQVEWSAGSSCARSKPYKQVVGTGAKPVGQALVFLPVNYSTDSSKNVWFSLCSAKH